MDTITLHETTYFYIIIFAAFMGLLGGGGIVALWRGVKALRKIDLFEQSIKNIKIEVE